MDDLAVDHVRTDEELLAATRSGSAAAVWELFGRHGCAVYALALQLALDEEAAQILVEDVFVTLYRNRGGIGDPVVDARIGLLALALRVLSDPDARAALAGAHS